MPLRTAWNDRATDFLSTPDERGGSKGKASSVSWWLPKPTAVPMRRGGLSASRSVFQGENLMVTKSTEPPEIANPCRKCQHPPPNLA